MSVKKLLNKYHFSYENNFLSKKKKHRFQINNGKNIKTLILKNIYSHLFK